MKKTRIISVFPACGKTFLVNKGYEDNVILDSDSSGFSWLRDGKTRNPDFPQNYIDHIKENIGKVDYILVSSHIDVRRALEANELCWSFVRPDKALLTEWVGRCYIRGNSEGFIKALRDNWDDWTGNIDDPMPNATAILKSNEYLSYRMYFLSTSVYN
jgi:hypothetical protein